MLTQGALLLHAAVETPAALTFLCAPGTQLAAAAAGPKKRDGATADHAQNAQTEAVLVLQNLGGLLAASVALSVVLAAWGVPPHISPALRGALCLCLASYHVFPIRRARVRLALGRGQPNTTGTVLGGPAVHLAAHAACLLFLLAAGTSDLLQ